MATDDERREVAERLRGLRRDKNNVTQLNHGPTLSLAWCVLGDELVECIPQDWFERMCARLADLIEPSGNVKCVAEVKVDGEKLKKLVHDAVSEYAGVDREALLALADEMTWCYEGAASAEGDGTVGAWVVMQYADRIRKAVREV